MGLLHTSIHHPRKLWLRRVFFQIHLWAGVLLSLYLVVIALTGSILVFEDELTAMTLPAELHAAGQGRVADVSDVVARFRSAYPGAAITFLTLPTKEVPAFQIEAAGERGSEFEVIGDPITGALQLRPRSWVDVVHDLHVYLLLGRAHGVQVNGVGAAILLMLAATGAVLWWPGLRSWRRGLRIPFKHNWRRINYDAHSAIGIWTLAIVSWWAVSGLYFGWYRQVGFIVDKISGLRNMRPPELPTLTPPTEGTPKVSLGKVLQEAQSASPKGRLAGLTDATLAKPTMMAVMDLGRPGDFSHRDLVTLDTVSGRVLSVWHYGKNESLGDWVLWAMHPLHFGTLWGVGVKILWSALGISLAVLSGTGVLMYWNRYLRKRWQALRSAATAERSETVVQ